ncbi:DHH family phosphoesterase [Nakamurella endophytica]|uniref:DHH family phosphoesterase n=1 Tax=Nakamurella endophytica TaxID=1748367 RepID=UPI001665D150|nr:DHH family phosphoesterase [Nakamurella endophytica]
MSGQLRAAAALLRDAGSVVVVPHVNPDADALGSALALGLGLERLGIPVQVAFAEPDGVPRSLAGLPGQHLVRAADDVAVPELLVSVDVNTRSRLGSLGALVGRASRTLVIDHHVTNTGFGTDLYVDPAAESTTVLVAALLDLLGVELDAAIAANLYAGLATDTVGFRHASPAAHRLAARWLETGVDADELLRPISDTHPISWLSLLSSALGRARLELVDPAAVGQDVDGAGDGHGASGPGGRRDGRRGGGVRLVSTVIPFAEARTSAQEELDSVIDILRTVQDADVTAVVKETAPEAFQVSLRSLPGVDVAAVATRLGGGGHVRAAGFVHRGTAAGALDAIRGQLRLVAGGDGAVEGGIPVAAGTVGSPAVAEAAAPAPARGAAIAPR